MTKVFPINTKVIVRYLASLSSKNHTVYGLVLDEVGSSASRQIACIFE